MEALIAKYGMRIILSLVLLGVMTGGYFYIKHTGAVEQYEEDMEELRKRNEAEKKESDLVLNQALVENEKLRLQHQQTYIGLINHAEETRKVSDSQRAAAINELLQLKQRVTSTKGSSHTKGRETNLSESGVGRTGDSCSEVSDKEVEFRLEIARLSDLALLCTGFVREVADVQ